MRNKKHNDEGEDTSHKRDAAFFGRQDVDREKERVKRMWRKECEGDREKYEEETGGGGDSQTSFDFNFSDCL